MENLTENTYWIAIAHLPRWQTERINQLIIEIVHNRRMNWGDFFSLNKMQWKQCFAFTDKELTDLETVKNDLPRLAFIAEQLQNEGVEVIPINSSFYPVVLKDNLKIKNSPPVIYLKGKRTLLQEDTIAIVGSRNAGQTALNFTDTVARKVSEHNKVVVSGFAKGVDKQALDSTLAANGKSIIVLPQGILTFQSGFNKYYTHIVKGDVAVISTFFPMAGWEVGLAMARNVYIYGLAKETYVAETDNKGGTWEGAMNGLKRQRLVYVRMPEDQEKNANKKLIQMGAIPVDILGNTINSLVSYNLFPPLETTVINEPTSIYGKVKEPKNALEIRILSLLKGDTYSSKEIKMALNLDWDSRKLSAFLKKNPNIQTIEGNPKKYTVNKAFSPSLFD